MTKAKIIISIIAVLILAFCSVGCEALTEGVKEALAVRNYTIVVDEDTLVQYIIFESNTDYPAASTGGMTVRVKSDGTPYTIDPEDLDKYEHFSFSSEQSNN